MNLSILVEVLIAGGAVLAGVFGLIRYLVSQNTKREATILDHHKEQQAQMMNFYEKKNNHIERIANKFAESNNSMTKVIGELTTEIKLMSK